MSMVAIKASVPTTNAIVPWLKIKDEIEAKEQADQPAKKMEEAADQTTGKIELGSEPSTSTQAPSVPATPTALKAQQPFLAAEPVEMPVEEAQPTERNLPVAQPVEPPVAQIPAQPLPSVDPQLSLPGTTYTWRQSFLPHPTNLDKLNCLGLPLTSHFIALCNL